MAKIQGLLRESRPVPCNALSSSVSIHLQSLRWQRRSAGYTGLRATHSGSNKLIAKAFEDDFGSKSIQSMSTFTLTGNYCHTLISAQAFPSTILRSCCCCCCLTDASCCRAQHCCPQFRLQWGVLAASSKRATLPGRPCVPPSLG